MPETMREILEKSLESYDDDDVNQMVEEHVNDADYDDDVEETIEASDDRVRDERGRFTKRAAQVDNEDNSIPEPESNPESDSDEDSHTIDPQLDELIQNRPSSFKSEAVWNKLVEGKANEQDQRYLAKYYIDRENDFHRGIGEYKLAAEKNYYLADAIEPYIPILQQQRLDPGQFIKNLAHTHYVLSTGSQEQKFAVLHQALRDYGVSLVQTEQGMAMAPMQSNEYAYWETIKNTQRELEDIKKWRDQENAARIQSEIDHFVADRKNFPHFDDLREDMAQLLENGHATTFEQAYADAYRRATRFSNVARPPQSNPQRVQQAKRAAVSPKSGSPTAPPSKLNSRGSLRADLESAFEQFS